MNRKGVSETFTPARATILSLIIIAILIFLFIVTTEIFKGLACDLKCLIKGLLPLNLGSMIGGGCSC